jgi:deoxycytidine triphosphate deaminase
MIARGLEFDQETYARAYAKYRRMCDQYSDFHTYTAERGIDGAIGNVISFFAECKAGVASTENRERHNNYRRQ